MCQLVGVSRAGFYRFLQERVPVEEDMEVRSVIQQIAIEHRRRYGYRRMSAELRRRGMVVNHKRVLRMMRDDNLLAVQPRAFVVTTDSDHEFEVYLNLASRMKLTGMNQLWVADITYIRLQKEFVYLAVILDRFSRKVVSWASRPCTRSRMRPRPGRTSPGTCQGFMGCRPAGRERQDAGHTARSCFVWPRHLQRVTYLLAYGWADCKRAEGPSVFQTS
jgi:hypothetical protein